jgi:gliding motility-associated-like protein
MLSGYANKIRCVIKIAVTIVALCVALVARGSHIVGMDLRYDWVTGNTYKITLVAYGDCAGSAFSTLHSAVPAICVYDGPTYYASFNLAIDTPINGIEITPVCAADLSLTNCTSVSDTIPGIKKFTFSGSYTMPYASAHWRFIFAGSMGASSGAGRSIAITNIASPSTTELIDTLNNLIGHNSSPVLSVIPTPFFCLNYFDNYNPGAVDPNSDSLQFSLVSGINGNGAVNCDNGAPVTYLGGHTGSSPLTATSFLMDRNNGQISFFPNATQRSLVVYNVEEYRDGVLVGTSQREMTFLVLTCTNPPPSGGFTSATAGTIDDSTHFHICANNGDFSVTVLPTEEDTSDNITVTATGLPTGATVLITGNNTPHPLVNINWTSTGVSPGTYTFYITFANDNCPLNRLQTKAYTVTIQPSPSIFGSSIVCMGDTLHLSSSVPGGTWTSSATAIASVASDTGIIYGVSSGTANISFSVAGDCPSIRTITVNPKPSAISGNLNVCEGATTVLSSLTSGGTWSISPAAIAVVNALSGLITGVASGSAIVTYTLPTGCFTTTPVLVTYVPPILGNGDVCIGNTITVADADTGGTWWSANASIASIDSISGILTGISEGTVVLSYKAPSGCFLTASVTVDPYPAPVEGHLFICPGTSGQLSDPLSGGIWTLSNATVASVGATTGWLSGIVNGTDTLTYTSPAGCRISTVVTVNPLPPIFDIVPVCIGKTYHFADSAPGGTWSIANPSLATVVPTTGMFTGISAGSTMISYATDSGCSVTAPITIYPSPNPAAGPTALCIPASGIFTETSTGGIWVSSNSGVATIDPVSGTVHTVSPGLITISYTLLGGCSAVDTLLVSGLPAPIVGNSKLCQFTNSVFSVAYPSGGTWTVSDSNIAVIDQHYGVLYALQPGQDSIFYTSAIGCTTATNITIDPVPPAPTGVDSICIKNTATFSDTVAGGTWMSLHTEIASVGTTTGIVTANNVGKDTLVYSTPAGCINSVVFSVAPPPALSFYLVPDACLGAPIAIGLSATGSFKDYIWNFDNGNIITANAASSGPYKVSWSTAGTYVVTLDGTGNPFCSVVHTQDTIHIHAYPDASIQTKTIFYSPNGKFCLGDSVLLTANYFDAGFTYMWQPSHFFNNNNKNYAIGQIEFPSYIHLTVTDAYGCTSTDSIFLTPVPCCQLIFPTAFSPNGDGLNDFFKPIVPIDEPVHKFTIANRWGQIVYESDSYKAGWDGYFGGTPQDIGTYFYYIRYDCAGVTTEQKGDLTLIR